MLLAWGLLAGACSEDKGNYDYTSINEVTIEAIADQTLEAGSQLQITPVIAMLDENNANLSYLWTIDDEEVSTERELDITLPPLSYGGHLCALTVRDNDNGMQYRQTFDIVIVNPFNWGYYFLTRKDDGSTEMAYLPAREADDTTVDEVLYATEVGEYKFGNEPKQIYGSFGYTADYSATRWQFTFVTQEGEYPVIVTDNSTFTPSSLVTSENFIVQDQGYVFAPDATVISQQASVGQFFTSNGQFIRYANGKLYRPARHLKDYYWTHPAMGASGAKFAWVFDELTKRYYIIQPYAANNEELGIIADSYAYDEVVEPLDNVDIVGNVLYAADKYSGTGHSFKVYTAASDGIHVYTFVKDWGVDNAHFSEDDVLPLANASENTAIAVGASGLSNGMFYVSSGNEIYSSPTTLPALSPFCTIPSELGTIEYLGLSALGNRLVAVLYDENSPEERKGSVVYISVATKSITHTFPHILHHCKAFIGGNETTSLMGYGQEGDAM